MRKRIIASIIGSLIILIVGGRPCQLAAADSKEASIDSLSNITQRSAARTDQGLSADMVPTEPSQETQAAEKVTTQIQDDPCLPSLFTDWREFALAEQKNSPDDSLREIRIVIQESNYILTLEAMGADMPPKELYRSSVALGDKGSPTPYGRFVINHIYCYPDVVFFDNSSEKVSQLYNGFFAPLLICEDYGRRCTRHRELGIHGFAALAHPNFASIRPETYGPVSKGCIRLSDPCTFKRELIRAVGIGPLKKNDRGSYHWLNRPVEVIIGYNYAGIDDATMLDVLADGLTRLKIGLIGILKLFETEPVKQ